MLNETGCIWLLLKYIEIRYCLLFCCEICKTFPFSHSGLLQCTEVCNCSQSSGGLLTSRADAHLSRAGSAKAKVLGCKEIHMLAWCRGEAWGSTGLDSRSRLGGKVTSQRLGFLSLKNEQIICKILPASLVITAFLKEREISKDVCFRGP